MLALKAEKEISIKMESWANDVAKNYNLILLCGDGLSSLIDADEQTFWCSKFMVRGHQMTIEEMRPIVEKIYQSFWNMVKEDKVFSDYVFFMSKLISRYKPDRTINNIGLRIDLWDENNDRYLYPHLSQVIVTGKQAHYYYADPKTQALQKPGIVEDLPSWVLGE